MNGLLFVYTQEHAFDCEVVFMARLGVYGAIILIWKSADDLAQSAATSCVARYISIHSTWKPINGILRNTLHLSVHRNQGHTTIVYCASPSLVCTHKPGAHHYIYSILRRMCSGLFKSSRNRPKTLH